MCFIMLKYSGYSALYNVNLHRLTCKTPLLHKVKKEKEKKKEKENAHFFLLKFSHCIWGANSCVLPNF